MCWRRQRQCLLPSPPPTHSSPRGSLGHRQSSLPHFLSYQSLPPFLSYQSLPLSSYTLLTQREPGTQVVFPPSLPVLLVPPSLLLHTPHPEGAWDTGSLPSLPSCPTSPSLSPPTLSSPRGSLVHRQSSLPPFLSYQSFLNFLFSCMKPQFNTQLCFNLSFIFQLIAHVMTELKKKLFPLHMLYEKPGFVHLLNLIHCFVLIW